MSPPPINGIKNTNFKNSPLNAQVEHDGPKLAVEDMIPEDITVEAGVVAQDFAGLPGGKKEESLSNAKPVDTPRLLKMSKLSRKPEYPGETVRCDIYDIFAFCLPIFKNLSKESNR